LHVDAMTVVPFKCEICGEIFETLEALQDHMSEGHELGDE